MFLPPCTLDSFCRQSSPMLSRGHRPFRVLCRCGGVCFPQGEEPSNGQSPSCFPILGSRGHRYNSAPGRSARGVSGPGLSSPRRVLRQDRAAPPRVRTPQGRRRRALVRLGHTPIRRPPRSGPASEAGPSGRALYPPRQIRCAPRRNPCTRRSFQWKSVSCHVPWPSHPGFHAGSERSHSSVRPEFWPRTLSALSLVRPGRPCPLLAASQPHPSGGHRAPGASRCSPVAAQQPRTGVPYTELRERLQSVLALSEPAFMGRLGVAGDDGPAEDDSPRLEGRAKIATPSEADISV